MLRTTRALMVSVFKFEFSEINHLTLESEQYEFMETSAREDLRKAGLAYMGGEVSVRLNYEFESSVITITISI